MWRNGEDKSRLKRHGAHGGDIDRRGLLCALFSRVSGDNNYAAVLFILAVFMMARFTEGYICGAEVSVVGVLAVNLLFTYPHFSLTLRSRGIR